MEGKRGKYFVNENLWILEEKRTEREMEENIWRRKIYGMQRRRKIFFANGHHMRMG